MNDLCNRCCVSWSLAQVRGTPRNACGQQGVSKQVRHLGDHLFVCVWWGGIRGWQEGKEEFATFIPSEGRVSQQPGGKGKDEYRVPGIGILRIILHKCFMFS